MKRLFLSAPTTCALLLGSGLLLRAQAMLRSEPPRAEAQVKVIEKGARNEPLEQEQPVAAQVGKGKQAAVRHGMDGVWREQKRSQSGNANAARAQGSAGGPPDVFAGSSWASGGGRLNFTAGGGAVAGQSGRGQGREPAVGRVELIA